MEQNRERGLRGDSVERRLIWSHLNYYVPVSASSSRSCVSKGKAIPSSCCPSAPLLCQSSSSSCICSSQPSSSSCHIHEDKKDHSDATSSSCCSFVSQFVSSSFRTFTLSLSSILSVIYSLFLIILYPFILLYSFLFQTSSATNDSPSPDLNGQLSNQEDSDCPTNRVEQRNGNGNDRKNEQRYEDGEDIIHVGGKTLKRVLKDVSGFVECGSLTAIIGPSGAGKSSLLEIIAGRRTRGLNIPPSSHPHYSSSSPSPSYQDNMNNNPCDSLKSNEQTSPFTDDSHDTHISLQLGSDPEPDSGKEDTPSSCLVIKGNCIPMRKKGKNLKKEKKNAKKKKDHQESSIYFLETTYKSSDKDDEGCISNMKNGLSGMGNLWRKEKEDKVRINFMGQKDEFENSFTVYETLLYASKLINHSRVASPIKNEEDNQDDSKRSNKSNKKKRQDTCGEEPEEEKEVLNDPDEPEVKVESPSSFTKQQGKDNQVNGTDKGFHISLVNDVIDSLGLRVCSTVRVGSISGGEQKRLSIGLSLLDSPDILILDEPTSGLDSHSAQSIVSLLHSLSRPYISEESEKEEEMNSRMRMRKKEKKELGIIVSIHQPGSSTVGLFDSVYCLSFDGRCILHSTPCDGADVIHGVIPQLIIPPFFNPVDWFLNIASASSSPEGDEWEVENEKKRDKKEEENERNMHLIHIKMLQLNVFNEQHGGLNPLHTHTFIKYTPTLSIEGPKGSRDEEPSEKKRIEKVIPLHSTLGHQSNGKSPLGSKGHGVSGVSCGLMESTMILLGRSWLQIKRNPLLTQLSLVQHIIVAACMSLIFSSSSGINTGCYSDASNATATEDFDVNSMLKSFESSQSKSQQNVGLLFFSLIFLFLASMMGTVLTFPLEMAVFVKETNNKMYTVFSYYVARSLADAPFRVLFPILYSLILFFLTGQPYDSIFFSSHDDPNAWWGISFGPNTFRLFYFIGLNVLVELVAQAKGVLIGAFYANRVDSAVFVAPLTVIPFVLFGGFFVSLSGLPSYLHFLSSISYFKYMFEASVIIIYGFDRCSAQVNTTVASLATNNPFFGLHDAMGKVNLSLAKMTPMLEYYLASRSVNETLIDNVVEQIGRVEKSTKNMFDQEHVRNFTSTSYVMDHFGIKTDMYYPAIFALMGFFVFFRILAYIVLYRKSKPKK